MAARSGPPPGLEGHCARESSTVPEARPAGGCLLDRDLARLAARRRRRGRLHALELPPAEKDDSLEQLAAQRARALAVDAGLLEELRDHAAGLLRTRFRSAHRSSLSPKTTRSRWSWNAAVATERPARVRGSMRCRR